MKLLLVLGSDDHYEAVSRAVAAPGFEMIRYRHVLKAMDNIDEIDPSAIVISARDFPRHWKILVQFVRHERPKEACPIVILKGGGFSTEETSKAFFLGVSGVLNCALEHQEDINCLRNILGRTAAADEQEHRFFVEPWHRTGLLIAGIAQSFIMGDVKSISANGLSFVPAHPIPARTVKLNQELSECSLRIGEAIISPRCRVIETGKTISLEFISFPYGEQGILDRYLEESFAQESITEKAC